MARRYLACHDGGEQILFAGVARGAGVADPAAHGRGTGSVPVAVPGAGDGEPLVFLRVRRRFRPVLCDLRYFPYTGQIYLMATSTPNSSASSRIGFTALDNAFGATDDPAVVQQICDG